MEASVERYVAAYVARRRTERQIARHDAEWDRWVARARLASGIGDDRLAEAARQRALAHGEAAGRLRAAHIQQSLAVSRLEELARADHWRYSAERKS